MDPIAILYWDKHLCQWMSDVNGQTYQIIRSKTFNTPLDIKSKYSAKVKLQNCYEIKYAVLMDIL